MHVTSESDSIIAILHFMSIASVNPSETIVAYASKVEPTLIFIILSLKFFYEWFLATIPSFAIFGLEF